MRNPFRILLVLIAPLHSRNILYLVKRNTFSIAVPLLRWHLKIFYRVRMESFGEGKASAPQGVRGRLPDDLLKCLAMMGFVRFYNGENGLLSEKTETFNESMMCSAETQSERLRSCIEGKSVALVGPSAGDDNSDEIDRFDLILRVGYVGPDSLPEGSGKRCDIAYYQGHKIAGIRASGQYEPVQSLSLVLLPAKKGRNPDKEFLQTIGINEEVISELGVLRFRFGSANALVRVLYHVLLCHPERVKVFNTDLFLSKAYPKGYIGNKTRLTETVGWRYEDAGVCRSFASKHNPIEQLIFYKKLYHEGYFEADPVLDEIIKMSLEDYCERLDELYGRPLREELGLI